MIFGLIIVIFLGLIFGSFGSVILSRRGESDTIKQASSILWGRSACPHCKTTLQARDLVPLLSFVFQKGRCRYCKKKISWLYPILELWSALIFAIIWRYGADQGVGMVLFWTASARMLWLMIVYDVLWYEIHIPLLLGVNVSLIVAMIMGLFPWTSLRWGLIFLIFFVLLYWFAKWRVALRYQIKEEGIWMGDVLTAPYLWTLLFAGLSQSFGSLDKMLAVLYFFVFSGIIGIVWFFFQNICYGKKARFLKQKMADQSLPFLPAMILAVLVILIFQKPLFWFFMF